MTKAELRTLTKQALGNRTGGELTDAWYDARVMEGYRRLLLWRGPVAQVAGRGVPQNRALRFPTMEDRKTRSITTAVGTNFLANQSGVLMTIDLYDRTNDVPVQWVSEADFRMRDPDETGSPREWYAGGRGGVTGYFIWPFPGVAADNIDVYETVILEPALATDGVEPTIPDEWHVAIVWGAAVEGAHLIEWPEKAAELENRLMSFIATHTSPGELAQMGGKGTRRRYLMVGGWGAR